jgi:uncharacterized membrane protein
MEGPRAIWPASRERLDAVVDQLRTTFGFPAALAMAVGLVIGLGLPAVDHWLQIQVPLFVFSTQDAARSMLETVATATVSVAGISFSVTIVAFTLSANQLSPRVLRSFRRDVIAQLTLASFLGTFVYCLAVLARLGASRSEHVPYLSIALAIVLSLTSFGLFALFIGHIVNMLQPSSIIASIAVDSRDELCRPFPAGLGLEPDDPGQAEAQARSRCSSRPGSPVCHRGEGFLVVVRAAEIIELAEREDALVRQLVPIGAYVLPGERVAEVWPREDHAAEALAEGVGDLFELGSQRTLPQDPGFPIRQLADVALKGLSPGVNDPTTATNALGAMTACLLRFAEAEASSRARVGPSGEPRLLVEVPDLDRLATLGFAQPIAFADADPVVRERIGELLGILRCAARRHGMNHDGIDDLRLRLGRPHAERREPSPDRGDRR